MRCLPKGVVRSTKFGVAMRATVCPLRSTVKAGAVETWNLVDRTLNFLRRLILGWESADQLSGPIGIARASGTAFDLGGVYSLVSLIGFMSVSIGLINLFPIPLLDGGHLLFYAIEAVRGRPLSEKAQEIGFRIGFALVAMLMLFATWNDLVHLGTSFLGQGS